LFDRQHRVSFSGEKLHLKHTETNRLVVTADSDKTCLPTNAVVFCFSMLFRWFICLFGLQHLCFSFICTALP